MTEREQTIRDAWNTLITHACDDTAHRDGLEPKEFNVYLQLDVGNERWHARGAIVGYRGITFVCKEGTATYDVNTIGYRTGAVLFDWQHAEGEEL